MIYDCFTFFNELEVLEIRIHELESCVDKFVLVESTKTHMGKDKPLWFNDNKSMFKDYLNKIIHIIVENSPKPDLPRYDKKKPGPWNVEHFQRNCIMRGLKGCHNDDIIIISDVDEIPRNSIFRKPSLLLGIKNSFYTVRLRTCFYYLNTYFENFPATGITVLNYNVLKSKSPQYFRDQRKKCKMVVNNAGWHFSYLGDVQKIQQKISSFSHSERNTEEMNSAEHLMKCISNLESYFPSIKDKMKVEDFSTDDLPLYVKENKDKFRMFIREI